MGWIENLVGSLDGLSLGLLGKLALAAFLGGVVGWEREASDKPAGLRTNLLICVGATLLAHVSVDFAATADPLAHIRADPTRIAAQIVSGVGFLGAGTIIQARGSVTGLTTAATLWVVAAIGIAVGGDAYAAAVGTTGLVLVALVPLSHLEHRLARRRPHQRVLRLVVPPSEGIVERLEEVLRGHELEPEVERVEKDAVHERTVVWLAVRGRREVLEAARRELLSLPEVRDLAVRPGTGS